MGTKRVLLNIYFFFTTISMFACDKKCQHGKTWATNYVTYSFVKSSYLETNLTKPSRVNTLRATIKGISFQQTKQLVKKAAQHWSLFSNIKLMEADDSQKVNIRIGARDLSGSAAGMGYFPGNTSLSGDIHMDNSKRTWTANLFYKVILHEMGHTLGLVHNKDSDSVMYYKIQDYKELQDLDIAHLQSLYGPPAPQLSRNSISVKWQAATYKGLSIPYYKAQVKASHSSRGEIVEIDLEGECPVREYTVKSSQLQASNVGKFFFKASKGWDRLYANADKNRNQCMRIVSKPFKATRNSIWKIERSYIFQESESVRYMVSFDKGLTFQTLKTETGSSRKGEYYIKSFMAKGVKLISLEAFHGKNIILAMQYSNIGTYWNTKNHGLKVHSISISNIYKNIQKSSIKLTPSGEHAVFLGQSNETIEIAAHYDETQVWSKAINQQTATLAVK
ncbi:MAG: matrixin family metalloprotease [Lentisphaeraceae bacterium]|nr:matrixin family metalloprotease [Lentisphaeraceae bacterium]